MAFNMDLEKMIEVLDVKIKCMPECESKREYQQIKDWLEELSMLREGLELGWPMCEVDKVIDKDSVVGKEFEKYQYLDVREKVNSEVVSVLGELIEYAICNINKIWEEEYESKEGSPAKIRCVLTRGAYEDMMNKCQILKHKYKRGEK